MPAILTGAGDRPINGMEIADGGEKPGSNDFTHLTSSDPGFPEIAHCPLFWRNWAQTSGWTG